MLTAAHCICDSADRHPKSATFCEPSDSDRQPVNQVKPYPVKAGDSIEKIFKRGNKVDTTMFNEIALRVGSKDITEALAFNAEEAFVFEAIENHELDKNSALNNLSPEQKGFLLIKFDMSI